VPLRPLARTVERDVDRAARMDDEAEAAQLERGAGLGCRGGMGARVHAHIVEHLRRGRGEVRRAVRRVNELIDASVIVRGPVRVSMRTTSQSSPPRRRPGRPPGHDPRRRGAERGEFTPAAPWAPAGARA
jgi:hypothetical protein